MEFEGARGLNTRTSKKALSFREPQKPSAATSKRAPSELTVEAGRFCPDTGFNVGSVQTLEHTSVIQYTDKVRIRRNRDEKHRVTVRVVMT